MRPIIAKVAFISHATEDEAIANTITDYLESSGVSCWVAPRDVNPGQDYSSEIVEAIESSAVFVLVLSEHANESIFVKREVERAVSKGKPVFPIRVREVLPSKSLELFISSAHWIDAWKPPMEKYLERLAQSISAAASVYPAGKPVPIPRLALVVQRRRMFAAAIVGIFLLGVGGWYAFQSLQKSSSDLSTAASVARTTPEAPAASKQTLAPQMGAPTSPPVGESDAAGPCPQSLRINRDLPTPFTCVCSAEAMRKTAGREAVWGTDIYTDHSNLCRAALHAGVISANGGPVTVVRSEGRPIYVGSSRNGVSSNDYGTYKASIQFQ